MNKLRSYLSVILLLVGIGFFFVPTAHASNGECTGVPSCDSGWQNTIYHDAYDYGVNVWASQAVRWNADDFSRTISVSGSQCMIASPYTCHRLDEVRMYYAVPGSGVWWQWYGHIPAPNYGDFWYYSFTPNHNDSHVFGWMVKYRINGGWVKAPIIYN